MRKDKVEMLFPMIMTAVAIATLNPTPGPFLTRGPYEAPYAKSRTRWRTEEETIRRAKAKRARKGSK